MACQHAHVHMQGTRLGEGRSCNIATHTCETEQGVPLGAQHYNLHLISLYSPSCVEVHHVQHLLQVTHFALRAHMHTSVCFACSTALQKL